MSMTDCSVDSNVVSRMPHYAYVFTCVQYACFTGDKTTTAVIGSKTRITQSSSHWALMERRNCSEHCGIYQQTVFSEKKTVTFRDVLNTIGSTFLNSVLEEKTDKDNINSNLYRRSESQTCNLFNGHLDSDQQVWKTFKLVMQCCCWRIKAHSFTQSHAAPKRPEVISFHWELAISRAWMSTTNGSH